MSDLNSKLAQQPRQVAGKPASETIKELLDRMKPEISRALPKHMNVERLARIALTTIRLNPRLLECSPQSLLGAVMQSAQLGLEPGPLGHAYLVPYKNEVTFIIGYKGYLELVRRSGTVVRIAARVVYSNDQFSLTYGDEEKLTHVPSMRDRGTPIGAYMIATLTTGELVHEWMSIDDIESIRKRSKAANNGPWVTDWDEMARKTVVRRGVKYLPLSIEVNRALAQDETVKTDLEPDMTTAIDIGSVPVREIGASQGVNSPDDHEADPLEPSTPTPVNTVNHPTPKGEGLQKPLG